MIAFFLMGLVGISIVLVGGPVVLFALMLETCRERTCLKPEALPRSHRTTTDVAPGSRPTWPVVAM